MLRATRPVFPLTSSASPGSFLRHDTAACAVGVVNLTKRYSLGSHMISSQKETAHMHHNCGECGQKLNHIVCLIQSPCYWSVVETEKLCCIFSVKVDRWFPASAPAPRGQVFILLRISASLFCHVRTFQNMHHRGEPG